MKRIFISVALAALILSGNSSAAPSGSAFTYQGHLTHAGSPANGLYEMQFTLFDAPTNGIPVGTPTNVAPVVVSNGVFTVQLDFSASAFNGAARWLEITVNLFGSDMVPTTLVPRQAITPTPYAINAANLMSLDNGPLDIKVAGQRALRLEPTARGEPNVIGGSMSNYVAAGYAGATIGGGHGNVIVGDYATVGGGRLNSSSAFGATVAGGSRNLASSDSGTVGGGSGNWAGHEASTIAGGADNTTSGDYAFIGGGSGNVAADGFAIVVGGLANHNTAPAATIGGGEYNAVNGWWGVIAGGVGNIITTGSSLCAIGGGSSNSCAGHGAIIAGGSFNIAGVPNTLGYIGDYATVSGGRGNRALRSGATVGGGLGNLATNDLATVGGGFSNRAAGPASTVAGGSRNYATESGATIGGGTENSASGNYATIAGGNDHVASGLYSTIGGGLGNMAAMEYATAGGGLSNTSCAPAAVVGGGERNTASGYWATVGGGQRNVSGWFGTTVGGGFGNQCGGEYATIAGGSENGCFGEYAAIGGGEGNHASGYKSTVAGGGQNMAASDYATVPGGILNVAMGISSFAAGTSAQALHDGAFVWADGSSFDFASSNRNEFSARATGGVRFVSAVETNGVPMAGVSLAPGSGTWSMLSDRNVKDNFVEIDPRDVLDKVMSLSLATWNYRAQDKSIRHLGPTAQDFHSAFGLGENERTIASVDADGVALAAIQGLNRKMEQALTTKDARIKALERQNASLAERVERLERLVTAPTAPASVK